MASWDSNPLGSRPCAKCPAGWKRCGEEATPDFSYLVGLWPSHRARGRVVRKRWQGRLGLINRMRAVSPAAAITRNGSQATLRSNKVFWEPVGTLDLQGATSPHRLVRPYSLLLGRLSAAGSYASNFAEWWELRAPNALQLLQTRSELSRDSHLAAG